MRQVLDIIVLVTRKKRGIFSLAILTFFIVIALFSPILEPLTREQNYANRFQGPSLEHPLGTDYAGRDNLLMVLAGSRDVLLIGTSAAITVIGIGLVVGLIAGYMGGKVDSILSFIINVFLGVPSFPVMLILLEQ